MIFRYHIVLPAQVAMILKVFMTLEGTAQLLSPSFSLMNVIQRYQRKALLRRLSPARRMKKLRRVYGELEHLLESLPRRTMEIMEQIQAGKFDVHLDHRGLEPSVNRLVLGMLASALFMGSALMLSRRVPPILFPTPTYLGLHEVSILGLGGCTLSLLLGDPVAPSDWQVGPSGSPQLGGLAAPARQAASRGAPRPLRSLRRLGTSADRVDT